MYSDRELLARLIQCEAGGEGDIGMRAVATVVMNRVHAQSGEFARVSNGGSIRNIIFQNGQFTCAMENVRGQYNPQNIYNMNPQDIHYAIADWAISGGRHDETADSLFFYNPYSDTCAYFFPKGGSGAFHIRVLNHCFYYPTDVYHQT